MPISKRLQDEINEASQRALRRRIRSTGQTQEEEGEEYVGPLDLVSGAVVAYSVRALSAAWIGQPLFTLRRDSDDDEETFSADVDGNAPLAAIAAWKDAAGAATAYVVTWYDQSGNGEDLDEGGEGPLPPIYLANQQNSKPGVSFPNSHYLFSATNAVFPSGEASGFMLASDVLNLAVFGEDSSYVDMETGATARLDLLDTESNEAGGQFNNALTGNKLWDAAVAFGSHNYKADGSNLTQTFDLDATGIPASITGFVQLFNDQAETANCCEAMSYASKLSDADRLLVRQNIAAYYGISLS